jgi:hypothetical protein
LVHVLEGGGHGCDVRPPPEDQPEITAYASCTLSLDHRNISVLVDVWADLRGGRWFVTNVRVEPPGSDQDMPSDDIGHP